MVTIYPEIVNATGLSNSNVNNEMWLSESQTVSNDGPSTSEQFADALEQTLHSSSQSPSKDISTLSSKTTNSIGNGPAMSVSDASNHTLETSDGPFSILSSQSDQEISEIPLHSSVGIIPPNTTKCTLETPLRPTCRDGSSLSSISDEETSDLSEITPSTESVDTGKHTLDLVSLPSNKTQCSLLDSEGEISSMSVIESANISKNSLQTSLPPTCKDGSSLSLYSDDEISNVAETAIATIGYDSDLGSSSSESEIEEDNVLAQLPQNLVAQTPQVLVDNSSDVHIGPHFQYMGPITVKQYITVNGQEAAENDNSSSSQVPTEMPHLKEIVNATLKPQAKVGNTDDSHLSEVLTDVSEVKNRNNFVINTNYSTKVQNNVNHLNNRTKSNGSFAEVVLLSGSEDALLDTRKRFLNKRCLIICLPIIIIICVCISLAVVLPGTLYSPQIKPQNINITCEFKNLTVSKGEKTIQWVVDISSSVGKLNVAWYGPECNMIDIKSGSLKYEIDTIYQENGKMQAVLRVWNVTKSDRGLYRLHVYNDKDERWDYFTLTVLGGEHVVACYVAEWAHLRVGLGKFTVDDIDPMQCTHLLYAFALLNISTSTIYPASHEYDVGSEVEKGGYMKMTSLKKKYPRLKVLISMGGWAERLNKNYTVVFQSSEKRGKFISSVVHFINQYNFDGLDLHWQYPTEQNGVPADKEYFVSLVKELRKAFDREGQGWLLTAPLGVMPNTIQGSYNIPEITKYLHYMFALCYAYHGFWDRQTGPNAPLYRSQAGDELNVEASIQKLLKLGVTPEKLVLGLPLYGRNFILQDEKDSEGFGKPTVGEGFIGPYVQETGTWGYNEICYALGQKHSNWIVHWDNVTHTPYMTYKTKFMSYDNEKSLTEKVEFALSKRLAGVVAYSLDTDDFRGVCAFGRSGVTNYPLMRAINRAFYGTSFGPMKPCKNP